MDFKNAILIFVFFSLIFLIGDYVSANIQCNEYSGNTDILSSGYSNNNPSATYHQIDIRDCPENNCFVRNIKISGRLMDLSQEGDKKGYVQISNPQKTDCAKSSDSEFSIFAFYKNGKLANNEFSWECGNSCSIKAYYMECFAIKIYADEKAITDVRAINYTLCKEESQEKPNKITGGFAKTEEESENGNLKFILPSVLVLLVSFFLLKSRRQK